MRRPPLVQRLENRRSLFVRECKITHLIKRVDQSLFLELARQVTECHGGGDNAGSLRTDRAGIAVTLAAQLQSPGAGRCHGKSRHLTMCRSARNPLGNRGSFLLKTERWQFPPAGTGVRHTVARKLSCRLLPAVAPSPSVNRFVPSRYRP